MAPVKANEIATLYELYNAGALQVDVLAPHDPNFNFQICLFKGDITTIDCDAIVNAANTGMRGGGGVDGAIHRAAGDDLMRECKTIGVCRPGDAVLTAGYDLPARNVIHAIGPIYNHKDPDSSAAVLNMAYHNTLRIAANQQFKTIAFPAISTGIYGYPHYEAALIALRTVRHFMKEGYGQFFHRIIFVVFTQADLNAYEELLPKVFPPREPPTFRADRMLSLTQMFSASTALLQSPTNATWSVEPNVLRWH